MNRKSLDRLLASGGLVVAILLVVGGALLSWAHVYVSDQVHSQLASQKIYFPPKDSTALTSLPAADRAAMEQFAGRQLVTGAEAKTWANHFIAVHLQEMTGGQTYAQLSDKYLAMTPAEQASPAGVKLDGLVQTVFRGETLRGLLLNAYAFDTVGGIAWIAAIVAYVGAAVMLLLAGLGFQHAHRVSIAAVARSEMPERERIVS